MSLTPTSLLLTHNVIKPLLLAPSAAGGEGAEGGGKTGRDVDCTPRCRTPVNDTLCC
jgi:hypothetical protein